ncbi:MAG: polyribonucleotide nucleotidyltransferase [Clostridia bacterium]|nr:polyribonucleotide nucleotidyltransferase [Clostridia bacterium]
MYENHKIFKTEFAGRPLIVETGKFAQLANGSALVRYGDTVILATATAAAKPRDGIDFFPLSVDFEERMYAAGKIPGGFLKREGRPSEKAILSSRVIDRSIRPLFPKDMRNDVNVNLTVMAVDQDCIPEIVGMIGASVALSISDIPFNGPISGVSVGLVDGEIVLNPTEEQREKSLMAVTVASTEKKVTMIEAGAKEVPEDKMLEAIMTGHKANAEIIAFINSIVAELGKEKFTFESYDVPADLFEAVKNFAEEDTKAALVVYEKQERDQAIKAVTDKVHAKFDEQLGENASLVDDCMYKLQKYIVRNWISEEGKRVDGRGLNDMRPLWAEVDLLPKVHGCGLFARGKTQVMTVCTLGMVSEEQLLDGLDNVESKRYLHHYNMPSFTVGEARPSRSPGRREIGHGALAERALEPVIPSADVFPYTIRLVSDVLTSNGSTSQGAICGSTLALMDAGVPISAPVAGISCGLITRPDDSFVTMVDIQGIEDFFGDMDFKVAGTKKGITAIQMDIKVDGLTEAIIAEALTKTRDARYHILDNVIAPAIAAPRADVKDWAPKIITMKIHPDKIREVIGSGGKVIQKIVADTGAKIDIEDDGSVFISASNPAASNEAMEIIKGIVFEPEVGQIYRAKVVKLMEFGAFVEFAPGKEGLVHISKLDTKRVEKVEDLLSEGDEIWVKFMEIDSKGRYNLSRKDALIDMEKAQQEAQG